jgi:Kef-type K+ transport system membrane component KefB
MALFIFTLVKIYPKRLFLIDSIGALLTAFMLSVVLVYFERFIGMPKSILYILAAIAFIFFIYSMVLHFKFPKQWRKFLRAIAIANLLYCILSLGFVIYHFNKLSAWGITYFLVEICIIVGLVVVEWRTASSSDRMQSD